MLPKRQSKKKEPRLEMVDFAETFTLAAEAVGTTKILVMTGWGKYSLDVYRHKWSPNCWLI
jgi:hypothetical protein